MNIHALGFENAPFAKCFWGKPQRFICLGGETYFHRETLFCGKRRNVYTKLKYQTYWVYICLDARQNVKLTSTQLFLSLSALLQSPSLGLKFGVNTKYIFSPDTSANSRLLPSSASEHISRPWFCHAPTEFNRTAFARFNYSCDSNVYPTNLRDRQVERENIYTHSHPTIINPKSK